VTDLKLTDSDLAALNGDRGAAVAMAMRLIVAMAEISGAAELMDITRAHIDGCLFHGKAGLEFAERLAGLGAQVAVPTTLNVSSLDLLHPDLYRGDKESAQLSRLQMDAYVAMGCLPTWTCAPYQLPDRPAFGEQIAWAESNAIVFANSVLGARTNRYGDFIDICAAVTGRVPATGLHLDENRRGDIIFRLEGISDALLESDVLFPVLGYLIGEETAVKGGGVPVIDGLPSATEDQLKALRAAAASSGAVGLFHAVGITPEAPSLEAVAPGRLPSVPVPPRLLAEVRDHLTTATSSGLGAVSLGTPHASFAEIETIVHLLDDRQVAHGMSCYVSTGRDVLDGAERAGLVARLEGAGVTLVTDTCTYITPIIDATAGPVMTDSAKWAFYAPGNIGVEVVFGSLRECVESAVLGRVWRDGWLWNA
jgi:predicted aconitase